MAKNKVVFGNQTLIDITDTTASTSTVMSGEVFYGADGERYVGELEAGGVIISDTTDSHGGTIREITTIGDPVMLQEKTVTPTTSTQIVTPDRYGDSVESEVPLSGNTRTRTATTSHTWQMVSGESYIIVGHGTINAVPVTISDEIVWSPPVSLEFSPTGSSSWPYAAYLESVVLTSTGATITYSASGDNYGSIVVDNIYEVGGYHGLNQVTVNPIPSQYIVPSGTISITSNATGVDVAQYQYADIDVEHTVATIVNPGDQSEAFVRYNNTYYYTENDTFEFTPGDDLYIVAQGRMTGSGKIYVNGELVTSTNQYHYTLPNCNIKIEFDVGSQYSYAYIGEETIPTGSLSITANGVQNVYSYRQVDVNMPSPDSIIDRTISGVYSNSTATRIGSYAFAGCSDLTEVTFDNVTSINASAFILDTKLNKASFPSLTFMANYAFASCSKLNEVYMPLLNSIPQFAFYNCVSLSSVVFGPNLSNVSNSAFCNCFSLQSISFSKITYIGQQAFTNCSQLTDVVAPMLSTALGSVFYHCTNISHVSLPVLSSVSPYAFYQCFNLRSVYLPSATIISSYAFYQCSSLNYVDAPNVTTVGGNAFGYCQSLSMISLPSLSSLLTYAFYSAGLVYAEFQNIISLPQGAFYNCRSLVSVSIPNVTSIFTSAFEGCTSLEYVYCPNATYILGYAFNSCTNLRSIKCAASFISMSAFLNAYNLSTVVFSYSGTATPSIYGSAFVNNYNLISLYLLASSWYRLANISVFKSTPISDYTASTGGVYGSIYVPASLYDTYVMATNWTTYSARFVSLTDAEIEALPF